MPEEIDGIEVDLSRLPPDLQPLVPFIRQWAVGDDVERSERVAAASSEDLQRLRDAFDPHWAAINAYLDENIEGPEPYEATTLDSASQAAMEAAFELERRGAA